MSILVKIDRKMTFNPPLIMTNKLIDDLEEKLNAQKLSNTIIRFEQVSITLDELEQTVQELGYNITLEKIEYIN